jgi:hypothetical protein
MSAARRASLAVAALVLAALGLRLWGLKTGLPFVYNADENAHFVPRAIGMFGHTYNPGYFINPPAFTYLLHVVFALRWGGDGVQAALAADVGDVFVVARACAAVLGAVAVAFLYAAGTRLFADRRVGFLAAALLATGFLPVFYSHFALNDVPALAPLCLGLVGVAGVLHRGSTADFAVAGLGLGLAAATKYTAGIVVLCLAAAALAGPGRRIRGLGVAGAVALAAFAVANPYALLDLDAFIDGLTKQSSASNDGGGKLGLTQDNGLRYYLETITWGLGWLPAAAALGGAVGLVVRDRRRALVLIPAVVAFLLFMGLQDRFFARWLLPIFPLLCLLAAWGTIALADALPVRARLRPVMVVAAGILVCAQGIVYSVHNDAVLARADTRMLVRDWLVDNVPEGAKMVVEPVFPDQWVTDPGRPSAFTGNGSRWIKWATSRSTVNNDGTVRKGRGRIVKLEDYERTTRPELVDAYERGGFCWVVTGSTQYGRAYAEPQAVPNALRYYDELRRRADVVFRVSPYATARAPCRSRSTTRSTTGRSATSGPGPRSSCTACATARPDGGSTDGEGPPPRSEPAVDRQRRVVVRAAFGGRQGREDGGLDGGRRAVPVGEHAPALGSEGHEPPPPVRGVAHPLQEPPRVQPVEHRDQVARVDPELSRQLALADPGGTLDEHEQAELPGLEADAGQGGDERPVDRLRDAHHQEPERGPLVVGV